MEAAIIVYMYIVGMQAAGGVPAPVPYHLTAACQAQTVNVANSNYSYSSVEHCLRVKA